MEVIYSKDKQISIKESILTVGSYDGIHLGHRELLSVLVQNSKDYGIPSIVVTFDPHPREILNQNFGIQYLIRATLQIRRSTYIGRRCGAGWFRGWFLADLGG